MVHVAVTTKGHSMRHGTPRLSYEEAPEVADEVAKEEEEEEEQVQKTGGLRGVAQLEQDQHLSNHPYFELAPPLPRPPHRPPRQIP